MESTALLLRYKSRLFQMTSNSPVSHSQYDQVAEAAKAASEGDLDKAADHLEKAQEEIDIVVRTCYGASRNVPLTPYRQSFWIALSFNSAVRPFRGQS